MMNVTNRFLIVDLPPEQPSYQRQRPERIISAQRQAHFVSFNLHFSGSRHFLLDRAKNPRWTSSREQLRLCICEKTGRHSKPVRHSLTCSNSLIIDAVSSAYREQFGCNFTSAIPTNIFGPADNLSVHSL